MTLHASPTTPVFSEANFTYDGDGKRVKSVIGSDTTLFVGSHYEITGSSVTKYYYAGSQRSHWILNNTRVSWLYIDQAFVVAPFIDNYSLWLQFAKDDAKIPGQENYSMVYFK